MNVLSQIESPKNIHECEDVYGLENLKQKKTKIWEDNFSTMREGGAL